MTKVLIIRFSSIGDIVLTTPVIRNLKQQMYGGVEIHYITKKAFVPVLEPNPYISKIYSIERSTNEIIDRLQSENYDYLIDLHNNIRSSFLKRKLKRLSFTFNKLNWQKWLLVNFGINKMPDIHIVDRYMQTIKPFQILNDNKGLDYFIPSDEEYDLSQIEGLQEEGYIAMVIGAAHWRKQLPVQRLVELCNRITEPVVLLGGPSEKAAGEQIARDTINHKVYNLAGKCSLHGSASLVKQSKLVITHDTGLMHIAAAFHKKIISIWGATVPEFGMFPYQPGQGSVMVQANHLQKRPCSKLGSRCKYKTCRCIEEIPLEPIVEASQF